MFPLFVALVVLSFGTGIVATLEWHQIREEKEAQQ